MHVIYLTGLGRSGTTILGNVLATAEPVEHIGELEYLQRANARGGQDCGCGRPVEACHLWRQVATDCGPVLQHWQSLRRQTTRLHHMPRHVRNWRRKQEVYEYASLLSRIYHSIGAAGVNTLVDSSKRPAGAFSAYVAPAVQTHVLHVVRDPRAVAYSRGRRVKHHGPDGQGNQMKHMTPSTVARAWLVCNLAVESLVRNNVPESNYRLVRYEDIVAAPREQCRAIAQWVGLDPTSLAFTDAHTVQLESTHTVNGNPNRFSTGLTEIRPDEQWRDELPTADRLTVSSICAPLMRHYGYSAFT